MTQIRRGTPLTLLLEIPPLASHPLFPNPRVMCRPAFKTYGFCQTLCFPRVEFWTSRMKLSSSATKTVICVKKLVIAVPGKMLSYTVP